MAEDREKRHLPRLDHASYVGRKHVMFDLRLENYRKLFVKREPTEQTMHMLERYMAEYECGLLCYVFMPDHIHMITVGQSDSADALTAHDVWKGEAGVMLKNELAIDCERVFQKQSYDHVMRSWEYASRRLLRKAEYIVSNPVRKGLVTHWKDYPYIGSTLGSYDIRHPFWWDEMF